MTDKLERLKALLLRYSTKVNSDAEEAEMYALLNDSSENEVEVLLTNILENTEPSYDAQRRERILASVLQHTQEEESSDGLVVSMKPRIQLWKRIAVAASVVGVLFVAGYWLMDKKTIDDGPQTIVETTDVQAPDKNRAQIKLADGTVVYLDSAANGELVNVNGVMVMKTADGRIEYSRQSGVVSGELKYNTLSNPRGSMVMDMTLSDGSRVWLNAGSSITYPVAFIGNERKVSIEGEAYFEVAHNPNKPFYVSKADVQVQVLGTHFNVNAYDDETDIKITLLEGSVKVSNDKDKKIIKPGEQAVAVAHSPLTIHHSPDLDQVMAWKNGMFDFAGADMKTVMRQLARWYDVDVVYKGEVKETFYLKANKSTSLVNMFKVLERTSGVKLKLEGKTITVQP